MRLHVAFSLFIVRFELSPMISLSMSMLCCYIHRPESGYSVQFGNSVILCWLVELKTEPGACASGLTSRPSVYTWSVELVELSLPVLDQSPNQLSKTMNAN